MSAYTPNQLLVMSQQKYGITNVPELQKHVFDAVKVSGCENYKAGRLFGHVSYELCTGLIGLRDNSISVKNFMLEQNDIDDMLFFAEEHQDILKTFISLLPRGFYKDELDGKSKSSDKDENTIQGVYGELVAWLLLAKLGLDPLLGKKNFSSLSDSGYDITIKCDKFKNDLFNNPAKKEVKIDVKHGKNGGIKIKKWASDVTDFYMIMMDGKFTGFIYHTMLDRKTDAENHYHSIESLQRYMRPTIPKAYRPDELTDC